MIAAQRIEQSADEEFELWQAFKADGSSKARERLFNTYTKYAYALAWRYFRRYSQGDLDIADLQQLAFSGLLEAIDRFDPERAVPFKAFAAHRITGCIRDGVAHMTEVREQISWRQRLRRERIKSLAAGEGEGRSDAVGTLSDVAIGLALGYMLEDTGMMRSEDEVPSSRPSAYESSAWRQLMTRLQREFSALPKREATLLKHHYMEGLSFDQIAKLFGLSNARISQLHRTALMTLKKRLAAAGHFKLEN